MKIHFNINYNTQFGEVVHILGNTPELGAWNEAKSVPLASANNTEWSLSLDSRVVARRDSTTIAYFYLIKAGNRTIRKEWNSRRVVACRDCNFFLHDSWQDVPRQHFFYTSAFSQSFFKQKNAEKPLKYLKQSILLVLACPFVEKNQELILSGESDYFGNWNTNKSLVLKPLQYGKYAIVLNAQKIKHATQYKFAIRDKISKDIIHWDEGQNRVLYPLETAQKGGFVQLHELRYRRDWVNWKCSGVAIPVFSLRSETSFGAGDFSDLKKMIDWAKATGMKIIQILPINDTTITRKWTDSYPYNAVSIYALHPIYLGLAEFPLKDKKKFSEYRKKASELNNLKTFDYEQVLALKETYIRDLFAEIGAKILKSKAFQEFFSTNEWLFAYACFAYFRDANGTADFSKWKKHSAYKKSELEKLLAKDGAMKQSLELTYFTQYLLHIQLSDVKKYAHENEVVLKGDIPIGISRNSVEAWIEPHLFNLDTQTGAPPDDFSVFGQNWGFPTYNWNEMAKNGYAWWTKRFQKMADYFDAYRIDHILGFFRIWEIPLDSVQGLLGYFSPAMPFSVEELKDWDFVFDEKRMAKPYIHVDFLADFFGEYTSEVIQKYLNKITWERYELKDFCDTQAKIKVHFEGKTDEKSNRLREGLYALCNEVLFVCGKHEPQKFHPRITAHHTHSYRALSNDEKTTYSRLYNHFFYERHNDFWANEAMRKLPALIASTEMLVCGEDLGMIPDCVPAVMRNLQILSLEIERMPKNPQQKFENLPAVPYLSVCTTSTHDMSPIRAWWLENRNLTQQYFNEILWKSGRAPENCTPEICRQIIENHLHSPAMLAILPWQDWMSISGKLRCANPEDERINIPANPHHYWQYRMHLTLENLLEQTELNDEIREMVAVSGR